MLLLKRKGTHHCELCYLTTQLKLNFVSSLLESDKMRNEICWFLFVIFVSLSNVIASYVSLEQAYLVNRDRRSLASEPPNYKRPTKPKPTLWRPWKRSRGSTPAKHHEAKRDGSAKRRTTYTWLG